jgi:hypothetical protein
MLTYSELIKSLEEGKSSSADRAKQRKAHKLAMKDPKKRKAKDKYDKDIKSGKRKVDPKKSRDSKKAAKFR